MKRFLLHISLFGIIIATILWIPQGLFDHQAHQAKHLWPFDVLNTMRANRLDSLPIDIIVMGNSRGGHYNPEVMETVYPGRIRNLSFAGFPFDFQYHIMLKKYLCKELRPKYIIQEVGPFCFFDYVNPKLHVSFFPYIDLPEMQFLFDFKPGLTVYDKFLPIKYRGNVDKWFKTWQLLLQDDTVSLVGSGPFSPGLMEQKRALEHDEAIIHLFHNFLHECDSLGIRLVLVVSPMHASEGLAGFDWEGYNHIMDSVTAGMNVTRLDYSTLYGSDTTLFTDAVHLNIRGRELFSKKIMLDLDSLGVIPCGQKVYPTSE